MFLRDVLAGWCKINNSESTHVIAKEIIWNSSQNDWYEKGIKLIEHKYDFRNQKCYTLEQLQYVYNIHRKDFFKYYNIQ